MSPVSAPISKVVRMRTFGRIRSARRLGARNKAAPRQVARNMNREEVCVVMEVGNGQFRAQRARYKPRATGARAGLARPVRGA
jgi:hypothetical protein